MNCKKKEHTHFSFAILLTGDLNTPGLRELSREILPLEVLVNDVDRSAIRNMLRINIGQRSPEESNSPNLDTEDSIGGDKELSIINYNIDKVSNS